MKTRILAGAAATALALAAAAPAGAAVYIVDWTGTVFSSYDYTGVFGPAGSLDGQTVKVRFKVDTGTPGAVHQDSPGFSHVYGGSSLGTASPVGAAVTINGVTRTISGNYYSNAFEYDRPVYSVDQLQQYSQQSDYSVYYDGIGGYITNSEDNVATSGVYSYTSDLDDGDVNSPPVDHMIKADDFASGYFSISRYIYNSSSGQYDAYDYASGSFIPTSFSARLIGGGVPEPATWALMIAGFGAAGASLRRRRSLAPAA